MPLLKRQAFKFCSLCKPLLDDNFDKLLEINVTKYRLYTTEQAGNLMKSKKLGVSRGQIIYALKHRHTSQKQRCGRRPVLDTPKRKQLIEFVTTNKATRREDCYATPAIMGWDCGYVVIANAID